MVSPKQKSPIWWLGVVFLCSVGASLLLEFQPLATLVLVPEDQEDAPAVVSDIRIRKKEKHLIDSPNSLGQSSTSTVLRESKDNIPSNPSLFLTNFTITHQENKNGLLSKNHQKKKRTAFHQEFSPQFLQSTEPWTNVSTVGYRRKHFYSGFRNQIMAFSAFCMWAEHYGHGQLLMETFQFKDTYGSDRFLPLEYLFDVLHWNSFYPTVPRLVRCSENFTDFDCETKNWLPRQNYTKPFAHGSKGSTILFANYLRYAKGNGPLAIPGNRNRNPIDLAILQGALRPHPEIQSLMDQLLHTAMYGNATSTTNITLDYWTLHPRVEPDMQQHKVCPFHKVTNLTDIIDMLYQQFPIPPAPILFLPINRPTLEAGAKVKKPKAKKKTNWLAVHNLEVLNQIRIHGLWNGTVRVMELGSNALNGTKYEKTPSTIGAMMNFYFALNSKVFVGTPVSSWSVDVMASRFYRGQQLLLPKNSSSDDSNLLYQNYQYVPEGVHLWTTPEMKDAPNFQC